MARKDTEIIASSQKFVSFFSHELKTPLTGLSAFTQLLLRYLLDKQDRKGVEYATRIAVQTEKLTQLVEQMLDISRLNSGTLLLNSETCDMGELLRGIFTREKVELKSKKTLQATIDKPRIKRFFSSLSPYVSRVVLVDSTINLYLINFPLQKVPSSLEQVYDLDGIDKKMLGIELFLAREILCLQKFTVTYFQNESLLQLFPFVFINREEG